MHKYKIPREVQIEDRIFGPITMRRLIILTLGGGITYIVFNSLAPQGVAVWGIPTFFCLAITISFAFLEPFGMKFSKFIFRVIEFFILPRQRLWDKRFSKNASFAFYASEHKKWEKKNKNKKPKKSIQDEKQQQRKRLETFSPLLDLDLSEIKIPSTPIKK